MLNIEAPTKIEEDVVFEEAYSGPNSICNLERSYIQLHAYAFSITYHPLITVSERKGNKSLLKLLDFYSFILNHGTDYFSSMTSKYVYPGPILEHEAVLVMFLSTGTPSKIKKCYLHLLNVLNNQYRSYLTGDSTYDQMTTELKPYVDRWLSKD